MTALTVFKFAASFQLAAFLSTCWFTRSVKISSMKELTRQAGDSLAVFRCMLYAVWAASRLLYDLKANKAAKIDLKSLIQAKRCIKKKEVI